MPTTSPLGLRTIHVRPGHPDFLDLPWHEALSAWDGVCPRLVEVERGLSRHTVRFVSYPEGVYAIKELPPEGAEREYDLLRGLERRRLPAVLAVGHAVLRAAGGEGGDSSVLITRFLEASVPYRTLFMNPGLERYRERLLDAIAGLIVRLHLAGFYWGDCSLSNTLFRRDAGELQACLVDAETSRLAEALTDAERRQDLHIMTENVAAELADLSIRFELPSGLGIHETGTSIRERYERLWDEITREETLASNEGYRIHERIRALNDLGFSVGEVELVPVAEGSALRVRTLVTDRLYHHHLLHSLTGIVARDRQAALMLNEIREMRALLSRERGRDVPMSEAAHRWLHERYLPASQRLQSLVTDDVDVAELYCQVLEHKWLMSESARHDVGFERALEDYLARARGTEPVA
jgi:Domain of unknown function (DUF4032)/Lipopolysaccharide kinase (Kdo/WaaP) family